MTDISLIIGGVVLFFYTVWATYRQGHEMGFYEATRWHGLYYHDDYEDFKAGKPPKQRRDAGKE